MPLQTVNTILPRLPLPPPIPIRIKHCIIHTHQQQRPKTDSGTSTHPSSGIGSIIGTTAAAAATAATTAAPPLVLVVLAQTARHHFTHHPRRPPLNTQEIPAPVQLGGGTDKGSGPSRQRGASR
ncbi:hypothetical protein A4X03_0g1760 [Tilletia caries]|uniref:Uncharacterized protein n=1 Tax=Tilletia caries TaxID=13290 RepID=A0A177VEN8_9BASI|nr:hypothetical protein A4X03_0g1760 [Tilletia caries]